MKVLYFASLREAVGMESEDVEPTAEVHTVGELVEWLATRGEPWSDAFTASNRVQCAVNQVMARPDTPISGADEVAFFPRVTGG